MISLQKLFEMQKVLDDRIVKEHNITHDRFDNLIMALLDEVGECAKETRCFKDWSLKGPSPREVILEEYVDGLHFILSLGLLMGYEENDYPYLHDGNTIVFTGDNLTKLFIELYTSITRFNEYESFDMYEEMFIDFMTVGRFLGFADEEIEQAYFEKNEVNHNRQDNGY